MKKFLIPLLICVIFAAFQALGSIVMGVVSGILDPDYAQKAQQAAEGLISQEELLSSLSPTIISLLISVTGILSVLVCWLLVKSIRMSDAFNPLNINWQIGLVGMLGAVTGILAMDILSEMFELPNLLEDMMLSMSQNTCGILSIAIVGPVVEELLFREGIIGSMILQKSNPWVAILFSALLFGLIHINPAQVPFAATMGIALGILYYKSGSIILPAIVHVFNNSIAIIEMNMLGEDAKDASYVEWVGGSLNAWLIVFLSAVISISLLVMFWRRYTPVIR